MNIIRQLTLLAALLAAICVAAPTSSQIQPPETITYIHNDLLGSPVAATNASGTAIWRETFSGYGERTNIPADTAQSPRATTIGDRPNAVHLTKKLV